MVQQRNPGLGNIAVKYTQIIGSSRVCINAEELQLRLRGVPAIVTGQKPESFDSIGHRFPISACLLHSTISKVLFQAAGE